MPDDLPGYLRVNEDCWSLLQDSMIRNSNKYTIFVVYEYDSWNDPNPYAIRGRQEARLDINFPDDRRAEMFSEQGGLSYCRGK
jgi:hypothetical protein